jgi:hypothetical protein
MVVLALLGVGLSTAQSETARTYWICLVPVFALLSIITAWGHAVQKGESHRPMVIRQLLHWTGVAGAIALDFYVGQTGEESRLAVGYNALLLLAVGCYLAGVYFEWRFIVVGLLLTATLFIVVKAEQYWWLVFVLGSLVVALLVGARWLTHRFWPRRRSAAEPPRAQPVKT